MNQYYGLVLSFYFTVFLAKIFKHHMRLKGLPHLIEILNPLIILGDGKDSGNNNLLVSDPNSYTGENLLVVGLPNSSKTPQLCILLILYCLITSIKIA